MKNKENEIVSFEVPRKTIARKFLKLVGRIIVQIFFKVEISGRDNFPQSGPLIVVGNHSAIMEAVLLIVFSPWDIEMLGAADIPHEKFNQIISDFYGFIPVNRGNVDRVALNATLNILKQKGVVGIFPEGGIWDPGVMRAQTGVAWISYRSKTSVLPIGFSGTLGAIDSALKFKRPKLTMVIGKLIPPLILDPLIPRKNAFEGYAKNVMSQIRTLILPSDPSLEKKIRDEHFDLEIQIMDRQGQNISVPDDLIIKHDKNLSKFFHRPAILKLFRSNLKLPIDVLENLDENNFPRDISKALEFLINYIQQENPYILTYRFGPKAAEEMLSGMLELQKLTQWAERQRLLIKVIPFRRYHSIAEGREIVQTRQHAFERWM